MSELGIILAILCVASIYEAMHSNGKYAEDATALAALLMIGAFVMGVLGAVYA